ncbi:quaternary amine ABC transporter ATP-binding protein [Ovoidimarina sediminis]|uniref:quaternary amine ABC transporter ATP-binding protein n=1 Tax=Ovoidimarina sediminis TaxID=3079856 RepID=UPI002909C567|nr:glycine betaine/L-proline ABC transporter ATP-binding protein [Rhodophyticola sp. MJ-SS7]MDU8945198.1 glycine betaine/L-proline ABC transporter ATP-binding protein [Rhodophyticola sp. MJ-SS7]
MSEAVVKLTDVWKIFGNRAAEAMAAVKSEGIGKPEVLSRFQCVVGVQAATFEVARGEIFCIMGLSGSGKSTLVRHINRLIEPTSGTIEILGQDVSAISDSELRRIRAQQIGMVFQHMALMPHRSVRDNVAYPLEIRKVSKSKRWAVSDHALGLVNLGGYEDRLPKELSGGMQQRVGIARALASDPEILLMDEPFSALDPLIRLQLQDQFKALVAQLKKTTLFITHDLDEAIRIGHRIAIMKDGVIVQIGTPEDIVMNPADDYVREFVQGISKLKLVKAHSIMEPLASYQKPLDGAPRADHGADLDQLIDLAVNTDHPVVITDGGADVGVVTKPRLLRGIQGGKDG